MESEIVFKLAAYTVQEACGDYTSDESTRSDLKKLPALPTAVLKEHPSLAFWRLDVEVYHLKRIAVAALINPYWVWGAKTVNQLTDSNYWSVWVGMSMWGNSCVLVQVFKRQLCECMQKQLWVYIHKNCLYIVILLVCEFPVMFIWHIKFLFVVS